ncbi:MAG TPA: DUF5916 domain-containing protein [Longimicrobiales bacterium]|nr:DUF5916 domain-containing protein [Longimicrobiales bacterium]
MASRIHFGAFTLLMLIPAPLAAQLPWQSSPIVEGRGAPSVTLPRADAAIEIDAVLDEPVWGEAVRLGGFWQYEPVDGIPAEDSTEVLAWYSADAVHFAVIAHDRDPSSIRATRADRDQIGGEDHVVLFLDTFDDRRRAFFFGVNPRGVQTDGVRTEGGVGAGNLFGGVSDDSPDYLWQSAGRVTDSGWIAEIRIPFESLILPSNEPQRWSFQVLREVQRTGHTYSWTDARRASASFLLQAGALEGIVGIERGVTLEAQPFVTAGLDRFRDEATGDFGGDGFDPDVGVNLHAGFGAHSLDLTVNPDFSQVEADAAQIRSNERFALFFPEKRPFFLEGIELFATPNQLVYTRRIVDPDVGAKMTGKVGPLGYAVISAIDNGLDAAPEAFFNIARLRTDFGTNSLAGIVFTDRSEFELFSDDGLASVPLRYNRVLAGDVRHVFRELYFIEAQYARSWTGDADGPRGGELWELTYDRTGRFWGFNYSIVGVSDEFDADAGFINRGDFVSLGAFNRFRWYGDPGELMETLTMFFGPTRLWDYEGDDGFFGGGIGDPIEGNESLGIQARLRGGWQIDVAPARGFNVFDPADFAGIEIDDGTGATIAYTPLDEVSGFGSNFGISTPVFQKFDADFGFGFAEGAIFAEGAEGRGYGFGAELDLRPTSWLRVDASIDFERIERTRDGSEFARALIPRLQTEVQPTRALFFRLIGEWTDESRAALVDAREGRPLLFDGMPVPAFEGRNLRLDVLASYEPTPGTVAFLGYGTSFGEGDDFAFRERELIRREDGFFLKLAYRWRR